MAVDHLAPNSDGDLSPSTSRQNTAALNLIFNYASSGLTLATGLLFVPLYLKAFSLATYGAWLATGGVLNVVSILEMGLNLVFCQKLSQAAAQRNGPEFSQITAAGMFMTICSALAVSLISCAIARFVPATVHAPVDQYSALAWSMAVAGLGASALLIQLGFGAVAQAWQMPTSGGVASLVGTALGALVTVVGLLTGVGVFSLALGALVRGVAGLAVLGYAVAVEWRRRRLARPVVRRDQVLALTRATLPVAVSRIGGAVLNNSETTLAAMLLSAEAAGVLALTGRVYSVCTMFLLPIGSSVFAGVARLTHEGSSEEVHRVLKHLFRLVSWVTAILIGGAIALDAPFVRLWVGEGKFGGIPLSIALGLSVMLTSRINVAGFVITALGHIKESAWISLFEGGARLALIFILFKIFGLLALPLAAGLATLMVGATYLAPLFQRTFPIDPRSWRTLLAGGAELVAFLGLGIALSLAPQPGPGWMAFAVRTVVVGLAFLTLAIVLGWRDRELILRMIGRPLPG